MHLSALLTLLLTFSVSIKRSVGIFVCVYVRRLMADAAVNFGKVCDVATTTNHGMHSDTWLRHAAGYSREIQHCPKATKLTCSSTKYFGGSSSTYFFFFIIFASSSDEK